MRQHDEKSVHFPPKIYADINILPNDSALHVKDSQKIAVMNKRNPSNEDLRVQKAHLEGPIDEKHSLNILLNLDFHAPNKHDFSAIGEIAPLRVSAILIKALQDFPRSYDTKPFSKGKVATLMPTKIWVLNIITKNMIWFTFGDLQGGSSLHFLILPSVAILLDDCHNYCHNYQNDNQKCEVNSL